MDESDEAWLLGMQKKHSTVKRCMAHILLQCRILSLRLVLLLNVLRFLVCKKQPDGLEFSTTGTMGTGTTRLWITCTVKGSQELQSSRGDIR